MENKKNFIFKGLSFIYLNQIFRTLAFSLISIFIPIYLLNWGYSFNSVLIFYLINFLVLMVFVPVSLILSRKFGYKKIIISNIPIAILYLILLSVLTKFNIHIYFLAFLGGIEQAFYWMPLHSLFIRLGDKEKRGTQYSNYSAFGQIAGLLAPLIGALLIVLLSFGFVIYISIIFIILSAVPLFKLENIKPKIIISFSRVRKLLKNHKSFFFGNIAENLIGFTDGIIWPIFIYFTLKNLISVGYISIIVSFGTLLFTLYAGRFSDKKDKYVLLKIGGLFYAIIWVLRIYFTFPIFLYIISLVAGFFSLMIVIPFQKITYDKAGEENEPDEFIIFREFSSFIGRAIILIFMIIFADKFVTSFIIAALACLFFVFFRFEKRDKKLVIDE